MARNREQILSDKLDRLRRKREYRVNKYILPVEQEIAKTEEQIKDFYRKKGIPFLNI